MLASQEKNAAGKIKVIADQLHSAAIHLLRRLRKEDDASGLSAPRLSALSVVVFRGPVSLKDLAAAEQVRPPTMTRIVTALRTEGLVKVRVSATDARYIQISATRKGLERLKKGRTRRLESLASKLSKLAPEARDVLGNAARLMEEIARMPD